MSGRVMRWRRLGAITTVPAIGRGAGRCCLLARAVLAGAVWFAAVGRRSPVMVTPRFVGWVDTTPLVPSGAWNDGRAQEKSLCIASRLRCAVSSGVVDVGFVGRR